MSRLIHYIPRAAMFLAGAAVAAITIPRRERGMAPEPAELESLKQSIAGLEARLQSREAADSARFQGIEAKLEEHAARLGDVPSTSQIVTAMEELLSRTMSSIDDRLRTQAHSIEILKTTVSQTDGLLERVLESLDSLQGDPDPSVRPEDSILTRPVI